MARRSLPAAAAALSLTLATAATAAPAGEPAGARAMPNDPALVKRGAYLVQLGGCHDCHTPVKLDRALGMPVPDLSRALSGHPEGAPDPAGAYTKPDSGVIGPTFTSFALPFGIVYSSNVTSDRGTGIGAWTEETFIRTMRTGKRGGSGRPVLPPMPWFNLSAATDDDLRAMFAYLQSTTPVKNKVPPPKVPPEAVKQIAAAYEKMLAGAKHGGAAGGAAGAAPGR
jgi:mono/diheme cytochrome c family protein